MEYFEILWFYIRLIHSWFVIGGCVIALFSLPFVLIAIYFEENPRSSLRPYFHFLKVRDKCVLCGDFLYYENFEVYYHETCLPCVCGQPVPFPIKIRTFSIREKKKTWGVWWGCECVNSISSIPEELNLFKRNFLHEIEFLVFDNTLSMEDERLLKEIKFLWDKWGDSLVSIEDIEKKLDQKPISEFVRTIIYPSQNIKGARL